MSNLDLVPVHKPVGLPDDKVSVLNSRRGKWEDAYVIDVNSIWVKDGQGGVDVIHSYSVRLERKSNNGNDICIHVKTDQIKNICKST